MEVVITAITAEGEGSTMQNAMKTFNEVMTIAKKIGGRVVYGRGFDCGTQIVLEK